MFYFFNNPRYDFTGTYQAIDIARYIIYICSLERKPISNLQLQKILYYIQEFFLKNERRALFIDEIEAWPFGPVVRDVYYHYCGYGAMEIYDDNNPNVNIDLNERQIIESITREKSALKPWKLVEDTHASGKAWDLIYCNGEGYKKVIPKDVIVTYG